MPLVRTLCRLIVSAEVTVRLVSAVPPPTAAPRETAPVPAVRVSACALLIVLVPLNVMFPSAVPSVSIVTPAPNSTGPVNNTLPPPPPASVLRFPLSVVLVVAV